MTEPVAATARTRRSPLAPWDQQPGENDLWFARFVRYVALGPSRSVSLVAKGRRNAYPIGAHWPIQAKQNNWRERAAAFDEAARKDPKVIDALNLRIEALHMGTTTPPMERSLLKGLRYQPPDEDDYEDEADAAASSN